VEPPRGKAVAAETFREVLRAGGDMGEMTEGAPMLDAYVREYATPEFACAMVPIPPNPPLVFNGITGLKRAWEEWGSTFSSVRAVAEEVIESEDAVVMFVQQIAVTRHGGVEIAQPSAMVWLFEEGGLRRVEFHLDRRAALRAGGIE